jgi:hypothetical protein
MEAADLVGVLFAALETPGVSRGTLVEVPGVLMGLLFTVQCPSSNYNHKF